MVFLFLFSILLLLNAAMCQLGRSSEGEWKGKRHKSSLFVFLLAKDTVSVKARICCPSGTGYTGMVFILLLVTYSGKGRTHLALTSGQPLWPLGFCSLLWCSCYFRSIVTAPGHGISTLYCPPCKEVHSFIFKYLSGREGGHFYSSLLNIFGKPLLNESFLSRCLLVCLSKAKAALTKTTPGLPTFWQLSSEFGACLKERLSRCGTEPA